MGYEIRLSVNPAEPTRRLSITLLLVAAALFVPGCRSSSPQTPSGESIVVTSPNAGRVERLFANEGAKVSAGTLLIELSPETAPTAAGTPSSNPDGIAVRDLQSAERDVEAARTEVVRREAEVQRLSPLVASGQATQAELDGARAQYEQAQKRLQAAQDAVQAARSALDRAREPREGPSPTPAKTDTIEIRAPVSGTLTLVAPRIGDRIIAGQALATIRKD
jgi:multidrug resistance efflux pump